jgi:hypothetical protein
VTVNVKEVGRELLNIHLKLLRKVVNAECFDHGTSRIRARKPARVRELERSWSWQVNRPVRTWGGGEPTRKLAGLLTHLKVKVKFSPLQALKALRVVIG